MYTEDNPPNALTVYGKTKAEGEYYCSNNYNLSIIIRTNVFGRNNFIPKTSFVESLLQNLEKNIPYSAFTDAIFSPIYVEELLEIVLELAQKKSYGTYNVVSSVALTKYEFAKTLAKAFDYDLNLVVVNLSNYLTDPSLNPIKYSPSEDIAKALPYVLSISFLFLLSSIVVLL